MQGLHNNPPFPGTKVPGTIVPFIYGLNKFIGATNTPSSRL